MPDNDLKELLSKIEQEARKGGFSIDTAVYRSADRDPDVPVLCAGNLRASLAVMGRDLGAQEVRYGEPLIGDAGRRVREAVYEQVTGQAAPARDRHLPVAMEHVLLTNTVPYKPVGNKAYPSPVKERFRPFIEELLVLHWQGNRIITLGTEAFKWYGPYAGKGAAEAFWARNDRYEASFDCELRCQADGQDVKKHVSVAPLPHPSPLNQTYWSVFPDMLKARLAQFLSPQAIR
jgi:Uracil-DNA glycosylase